MQNENLFSERDFGICVCDFTGIESNAAGLTEKLDDSGVFV